MRQNDFKAIITALNKSDVKYLIAGGMSVIAHGHVRLTMDIDLVIYLEEKNLTKAFEALGTLDYRPIVPVTSSMIANKTERDELIKTKAMTVLNFFSDTHPETRVDIFITEPFDFEDEYQRAWITNMEDQSVPFISKNTLIEMKKSSGRAADLEDIRHLENDGI